MENQSFLFGVAFSTFSESTKREIEGQVSSHFGVPVNEAMVQHGYSRASAAECEVCPRCGSRSQRRLCRVVGASSETTIVRLFQHAWFCDPCQTVIFDKTAYDAEAGTDGRTGEILGLELAASRRYNYFLTWNDAWFMASIDDKRQPVGCLLFPSLKMPSPPERTPEDFFDLSLTGPRRGIIVLKHPAFADRSFSCLFSACKSPTCPCYQATWHCMPLTADSSERPLGSGILAVRVDPETQTVSPLPAGKKVPAETRKFAQALQKELTADDWKTIMGATLAWKRHQYQTCDRETVQAVFPDEAVHLRELVDMQTIFPGYPGFEFENDGQSWWATDGHCVQPDCNCRSSVLHLAPNNGTVFGISPHAPMACSFDRAQRRLEQPEDGPSVSPDILGRLFESLKRAVPDFDDRLEENAALLQRLFTRWLDRNPSLAEFRRKAMIAGKQKRAAEPTSVPVPAGFPVGALPALSTPAAGRNDPCPCGSGKKYKKCCGA